jgi:alkylation response protein AidB-like acyl-CoA dehydrogenase
MTFEFTPDQQAFHARARAAARAIDEATAAAIDEQEAIPEPVCRAIADAIGDLFAAGDVCAAAAIEELGARSAGVAIALGLGRAGDVMATPHAWPGLRGAGPAVRDAVEANRPRAARVRLVVAATAVGVARAAVEHAVAAMKAAGIRPGGDEPTPYWTLADAATEVDAARLLTARAAEALERREATADDALTRAWRLAAAAAERAVAAAIDVAGPGAYERGAVLERLGRDARTLAVILRA